MKLTTSVAPENTLLVEARVIPSEIGFINALIEEYEGLAVIRTLDRRQGLIKLWIPEGYLPLLRAVCEDFISRGWMYSFQIIDPWWEIQDPAENPSFTQGERT
ncbi:MAG: DUF4911 domain-containing protein [Candidatus Omnitrophica bacterium]|nr:DUF4911 domain-containing protein [bacterium]MBK7496593.1 DUF4911 domain-containing protein [Candidatus Omnitrophota bacterium]MBV6482467.1 hypothetical protein [bacterium]MCE7907483.1 DUF4911 domain-containing protein [Candidatus Omnitrophica bacterium COP1]MCL4733674.1 DUF4911 domain-containing protein [Candidatus Omnitrophota bacterium]